MKLHYLFPALLLVGCASSHPTTVDVGPGPLPQKHDVSDPASIRTPEHMKAYPVGRYEDPNDPDVMHEGHTIKSNFNQNYLRIIICAVEE